MQLATIASWHDVCAAWLGRGARCRSHRSRPRALNLCVDANCLCLVMDFSQRWPLCSQKRRGDRCNSLMLLVSWSAKRCARCSSHVLVDAGSCDLASTSVRACILCAHATTHACCTACADIFFARHRRCMLSTLFVKRDHQHEHCGCCRRRFLRSPQPVNVRNSIHMQPCTMHDCASLPKRRASL